MSCCKDRLRVWGEREGGEKDKGREECVLKFDLEVEMIFKKWNSSFSAFD